ncbi:DUF397 domain-containing protein [Streptomyces sp. NPDC059445]|uniref:DUF397 domain-containing protein n=1 Tax=unclassified Streptomyces TaxID=2593676 RepID=UPI0036C36F0C
MVLSDPARIWCKSSVSGVENCVEVRRGDSIMVRDSKTPGGSVLVISPPCWNYFLQSIKDVSGVPSMIGV